MTYISSALRSEIARATRDQVRRDIAPLVKALDALRADLSTIQPQGPRQASRLDRAGRRLNQAQRLASHASLAHAERVPFNHAALVALRRRHKISAAAIGRVVGVSSQSVYLWERGVEPTGDRRDKLVALLKMKRADLLRLLERPAVS